jgi:predicted nucleic acid-binding Zn ribbon protein
MRKSNLIKLGDAITALLKAEKLDIKLSQHAVKNDWKDIVGIPIANHTTELYFNQKTLYITINSAAMRNEAVYSKSTIITNVNKFCGYLLIDQLVIK